jgi:hypothetical protein
VCFFFHSFELTIIILDCLTAIHSYAHYPSLASDASRRGISFPFHGYPLPRCKHEPEGLIYFFLRPPPSLQTRAGGGLKQANQNQRRPTRANTSQRGPTQANEGQRRSTWASEGQRRPTLANAGQRGPTQVQHPLPRASRRGFYHSSTTTATTLPPSLQTREGVLFYFLRLHSFSL